MKKPMEHPDYKIGPGMFNFTKWSRENIPKPPPKLKVGDRVTFTLTTEITEVGRDCDGTTLYGATSIGFGWGEECFAKKEGGEG